MRIYLVFVVVCVFALGLASAQNPGMPQQPTAQPAVVLQVSSGTMVPWAYAAAPTISSGFGTSPGILSSNGSSSFRVNVGTGAIATTGVIGLPSAPNGWNCQVTDFTNNTVTRETASTTNTVTVTAAAAWAASDTLIFNCGAF